MSWSLVMAQVVSAGALGAMIGLERELDDQPAGLRTHMLVALGSALFTLVGAQTLHTDPTRIAAQVVTGMGFLGAGAILRGGTSIRGLTTAASLWVTAAIGVAIGLEAWLAAVATAILSLTVLRVIKQAERRTLRRRRTVDMTVDLDSDAAPEAVERAVSSLVPQPRLTRVTNAPAGRSLEITAHPHAGMALTTLSERLLAIPGVRGVDLTR
ncbi:MAG: MgtC/SapB family protein [Actinoallomurus sp.]|nr:MgtC/SapB family protein [Actinoallomurus sp.]